MAEKFHLEFKRGRFHVGRVFNLTETELVERVVRPWQAGMTVEVAGKEWLPAQATLTILEGPELESAQLGMGRGWSEALRSGRDVSAKWLAPAAGPAAARDPRAVVVIHDGSSVSARDALFGRLGEMGLAPLDWRILVDGAAAAGLALDRVMAQVFQIGQAVVILLETSPAHPGSDRDAVLVCLGVALAADARRTVVVGDGAEALTGLIRGVVAVTAWRELAGRLANAGCPVVTPPPVR